MANLRANNLTGTGGRNAIDGSILLQSDPKSRISVTNTTGLDFGTDLFTIEFWIYLLKEAPVNKNIFARSTSASNTTGMLMWFDSNGHLEFDSAHGSTGAVHTGAAIATHTWHHIAVSRDGSNNTRLYLNGVNKASASSDTTNIVGATNLQIASNIDASGYYNDAYISNFRMVKGTAVYSGTSDFTPPTEKLTAIDGTILLCCQDSDDATQEATGKTISAHGGTLPSGDSNIIRNGDFSNGTTAWYGDSGAGVSASGGVATVTNGGGDYLYAIAQANVCRIGGKYRIRGTIVPTMSTSTYQFRVRAGGTAVSWKIESGLTSGSSYDFDTGEVTADGTTLEIGSGNLANNSLTQFTLQNVVVTAIDPPKAPKVLPPVGVDEGVTFGGDTKINSLGHMYFPAGDTPQRGRGRAIFAGGYRTPDKDVNTISYVQIQSSGNTTDFGDLTQERASFSGSGNETRGWFASGYDYDSPNANYDIIDYITIATTANALDFGNLAGAKRYVACLSNSTRGVSGGGYYPAYLNVVEYITIASTGDATNFGDITTATTDMAGLNSPTRGIFAGGASPSASLNTIEYITIASTGDATNFGDLTQARRASGSANSSTRGVFTGGHDPSNKYNTIDYITIASTGDATDFGDLSATRGYVSKGQACTVTRGLVGGGSEPGAVNTIQYITIASTGNAVDFGDISGAGCWEAAAACDSHGGLE